MTLAEQIKQVMDYRPLGASPSDAALMQDIIRQLTDIVTKQHEQIKSIRSIRGEDDYWVYEACNHALALSAPIVKGVE